MLDYVSGSVDLRIFLPQLNLFQSWVHFFRPLNINFCPLSIFVQEGETLGEEMTLEYIFLD